MSSSNPSFRRRVPVAVCAAALLCAAPLAATNTAPRLVTILLTVQKGVPLRVELMNQVPINRAGVPVEGRLVAPVYVFNRAVLPAGCEVLGRVTKVEGASRWVRARAILNGNFTPLRKAQVEFDTLVLADGRRVPIVTGVSEGIPEVVHLESAAGGRKAKKTLVGRYIARTRQQFAAREQQALSDVKAPGKINRLRAWARARIIAWLPYHRQAWPAGTIFSAQLEHPLEMGSEIVPARKLAAVGSPPPPESVVHARLMAPLDSATARRGNVVEAVITRPLFSRAHQLVIPQGSILKGSVEEARPARWLHRSGKLRFTFHRLVPPRAPAAEVVQGSLQGVTVASKANLRVGAEGGVSPIQTKQRFIVPALSLAMAAWTSTPDRDAVSSSGATVPGQGGRLGQVLSGGWGFGLLGSIATLAGRSYIVSGIFGFYGAAWTVYSRLLARGENVSFPASTPLEIRFGTHPHPVARRKLDRSQDRKPVSSLN